MWQNKETHFNFFVPSPDDSKGSPKKEPLEQSKEFAIIVEACDEEGVYDLGYEEYQPKLSELSRKLGCDYWTILHDKDIDEVGKPKRLHWHLVVRMKRSRRIKNKVIKVVSEVFSVKANRVSVLFSYDLEADIRYLMHLDDEDKAEYPIQSVITSDPNTLVLAYHASLNQLTFERLEDAYREAQGSKVGIIRILGVKLYRLNAVVIHDYIREMEEYHFARNIEKSENSRPDSEGSGVGQEGSEPKDDDAV